MRGRITVAMVLAFVVAAPSALAGNVSVQGNTLRYDPDPQSDPAEGPPPMGGGIELHIFQDPSSYEFETTGNVLNPGPGCQSSMSSIPGLAPLSVTCSSAGVTNVVVDLPWGVRYSAGDDAEGPRGLRTPELVNTYPLAATNLIHGGK